MRNPAAPFILFLLGAIGLTFVARNPRFENFHSVDVVQLLASGICFGVGMTLVVIRLRHRREQ